MYSVYYKLSYVYSFWFKNFCVKFFTVMYMIFKHIR